MKTLTEFLTHQNHTLKDMNERNLVIADPLANLSDHFYIEFALSNNQILEKHGVFDGQIEFITIIAKQIASDLDSNLGDEDLKYDIEKDDLEEAFKKDKIDAKVFFKKITIIYGKQPTGYDPKVAFDKDEQLIEHVTINLNRREMKDKYNLILITLCHELTHAWEDYNRHLKKDAPTLKEIIDSSDYKKLITSANVNSWSSFAKRIEYQLTHFEVNAYLAEIAAMLKKDSPEIVDYKTALELFKKAPAWRYYSALYAKINNLNSDEQQKFAQAYNKAVGTNFTTNKLIKKLNNRFEKIFRKIDVGVPKLYCDYFSRNIVVGESFDDVANWKTPSWIKLT